MQLRNHHGPHRPIMSLQSRLSKADLIPLYPVPHFSALIVSGKIRNMVNKLTQRRTSSRPWSSLYQGSRYHEVILNWLRICHTRLTYCNLELAPTIDAPVLLRSFSNIPSQIYIFSPSMTFHHPSVIVVLLFLGGESPITKISYQLGVAVTKHICPASTVS